MSSDTGKIVDGRHEIEISHLTFRFSLHPSRNCSSLNSLSYVMSTGFMRS